jgi:hypothetical protein
MTFFQLLPHTMTYGYSIYHRIQVDKCYKRVFTVTQWLVHDSQYSVPTPPAFSKNRVFLISIHVPCVFCYFNFYNQEMHKFIIKCVSQQSLCVICTATCFDTLVLTSGSLQPSPWVNKIQQDSTVCRYLFTAKSLYMFRVSIAPIIKST